MNCFSRASMAHMVTSCLLTLLLWHELVTVVEAGPLGFEQALEKRVDRDHVANQWNAPASGSNATPPPLAGPSRPPGDEPDEQAPECDDMDVDQPVRDKGKGPAREGYYQPASKELMDQAVKSGRNTYAEWLFATSTEAASEMMSTVLGCDPVGQTWQRNQPHDLELFVRLKAFTTVETTAALRPNNVLGLEDAFASLKVGDGGNDIWQRTRPISREVMYHGPNVRFKLQQDVEYKGSPLSKYKAARTHEALGGGYETIFNVADGVIVAQVNQDPVRSWHRQHGELLAPDIRPRLYRWSDLTWYHWCGVRGSTALVKPKPWPFETRHGRLPGRVLPYRDVLPGLSRDQLQDGMKGFLNYIFVLDLFDVETQQIVTRCLESRNIHKDIPMWSEATTFAVGHWCYYALLGTESSNMIAEFLAQHREDHALGHKVPATVTIFAPKMQDAGPRKPALVWWITDKVDLARTWKDQIEAKWFDQMDQPNFQYHAIEIDRVVGSPPMSPAGSHSGGSAGSSSGQSTPGQPMDTSPGR